ncbi:MAG: hypothetical protein JSS60_06685 [Verrucomicrobia bacterium]|nr:hypothetical protein [Verrucomicrobiota bacterium]
MTSRWSLGTIINFCSNDYPFLRHSIDSVKPFSSQILIPVCDHFFDGKEEDRETLDRIYAENPDVQFLEFPFNEKGLYGSHSSVYWHNLARLIGRFFLKEEIQFALFLDCDEVVDTPRFIQWLETFPYQDYASLRLLNYWYFRESNLQARTWEDTPLLARKEILDGAILMNDRERAGMHDLTVGKKAGKVAGVDGKPLIHHYSWVRTKEQLLRKVVSWSHNRDRDWVSRVEEEFSRPFNGTDFVHGYEFVEVEPFATIDILQKPKSFSHCDFSHVRKLTHEEIVKIDISLTYQIPVCL